MKESFVYFSDISLAHSAEACTELFPILNGSAATTSQEFSLAVLTKTTPDPFLILKPPPVTNSSKLHVAMLCTIPSNGTTAPSSCLTEMLDIGAASPAGPCSPVGPGGLGGPWLPFCPAGPCSPAGHGGPR